MSTLVFRSHPAFLPPGHIIGNGAGNLKVRTDADLLNVAANEIDSGDTIRARMAKRPALPALTGWRFDRRSMIGWPAHPARPAAI